MPKFRKWGWCTGEIFRLRSNSELSRRTQVRYRKENFQRRTRQTERIEQTPRLDDKEILKISTVINCKKLQ